MPRRRKKKATPTAEGAPAPQGRFANRPFDSLKAVRVPAPVPRAAPAAPTPPPPRGEEALFADAMAGVRPLADRHRTALPPPVRERRPRAIADPDAEALAELSDLVAGAGAFDITDTTEFLEGAVAGIDRGLVRRLRRGDFAFRRHIDLHGMTVVEAREAVAAFFRRAVRDGERCVLVVHGRGLNSPDNQPVLKRSLVDWLSRGAWARSVLAFTSARPCDGGAGAMYVLLRRKRGAQKSITVTEGAKW